MKPNTPAVPYSEQLDCARGELRRRQANFPNLVARGKFSQAAADREINSMAAIVKTIEAITTQKTMSTTPTPQGQHLGTFKGYSFRLTGENCQLYIICDSPETAESVFSQLAHESSPPINHERCQWVLASFAAANPPKS